MSLVITALIFVIIFVLIYKFPVGIFMIGLTLHFNIGNYLDKNFMGFPNYFSFQDFALVLAFLAGISIKKKSKITLPREFKLLLIVLLLFAFYQIFLSIIINLKLIDNPGRIILEIASHKWRIFSIFICIPAYYVYNFNSKTVYYYVVVISFLILSLYFLALFTPIKLIETQSLMRGYVFGAERIWFENWGYLQFTIIMALVVYFLNLEIGSKYLLYLSGIMIFISTIITMTRGTIIQTMGSVILFLFIIFKYLNIKLSKNIVYSLILIVILVISIFTTFPDSVTPLYETFSLTYLELTGQIRRGLTQSRTEFELVTLLPLYLDHFFFGTGFLREYFDAYGTQHELGLADFAILGNLALYGTFGFITFLLRYFILHKVIYKILRSIKNIGITDYKNYDIVLALLSIISIYSTVLFTFHNFSIELVYGAVSFGLWVGFIFGFYKKAIILQKSDLI